MDVVDTWTGELATALQRAFRMSNDGLASKLGIAVRTVAKWHSNPKAQLSNELQQALDTLLTQATEEERKRFAAAAGMPTSAPSDLDPRALERLDSDPDIGAALHWVDERTGYATGTARAQVIDKLSSLSLAEIHARSNKRSAVSRQQVAEALQRYYQASDSSFGAYTLLADGQQSCTTILTRPEWVGLGCPIPSPAEHFTYQKPASEQMPFSEVDADAALGRIAETVLAGTRLVNSPIYRLCSAEVAADSVSASMTVVDFIAYALTVDLLEGEVADELSSNPDSVPKLPLRDLYLPSVDAVVRPGERICAGGVLALTAIARPADGFRRSQPDYALLVQERGGQVLNANRKLAVIPKCFHGPLANFREDAPASSSLFREMEEELFGRDDVDSTLTKQLHADPMHPSNLSEPMKWLLSNRGAHWAAEYTAFGYNLVSGNYEYPSLIAVHDEAFWEQFGGDVSANWESESLRQYSSLDEDGLAELISDPNWSNEGLFAFTQGLMRLAQMSPDRVKLPPMNWEVRL